MSLKPLEPLRTQTEAGEASDGFLARWSRRKLAPDTEPEHVAQPLIDAPVAAAQIVAVEIKPAPETEPRDPRTGKPMSELTDEDMPAIELLNAESDLRCFMSGKVSQALRMQALTKVFHSPKYNQICICAEYADDYTNFAPLGDIVPHDLKQAIAREAGKLLQRLAAQGVEMTSEEAESRVASEFRGEKLQPLPVAIAASDAIEPPHSPNRQADIALPATPSESS